MFSKQGGREASVIAVCRPDKQNARLLYLSKGGPGLLETRIFFNSSLMRIQSSRKFCRGTDLLKYRKLLTEAGRQPTG